MPKQASRRQKGIQRGIQRQRVRGNDGQTGENYETEGSEFIFFNRSKLSSFGKKCFDFMLACCEKFGLIGFRRAQNGELVPLSRKGKIWHYATAVVCLALCIQKTWGTVHMFFYEELRMESFICLSVAIAYNVGYLTALAVVLRPKETMDLHNSWAYISESLQRADPGCKCNPLDNMPACLKVIFSVLVCQGTSLAVALSTVIVDDLPISLFPMAEKSGLLPDGVLPRWTWPLMFAPLEWLMAEPFVLVASLSAEFFFIEHGLLDTYLQRLRNINVRSMRSRRRVEHMYVQLELFNRIGQNWIRVFFPPWLVGLSSGIIVMAFVSIRYTELPLILYIFFPYVGGILILVIFWQSYDMFRTIGASECILGALWQHSAPYLGGMNRAERVELMKRSKAMRPLAFSIADSEFSLNLPINTWDEIVNQTIFLLSL